MNKRKITRKWWREKAVKQRVAVVAGVHLLACLGPWYFTWTGLACFVGLYLLSGLGVTLCYHRLLTHGSFKTHAWVRKLTTLCACLAWEGPPIRWVSVHRLHHSKSDKEGDPHSPRNGFGWAHYLWVLSEPYEEQHLSRYAKDLEKEPFMVSLNRWHWLPQVVVILLLGVFGYIEGGKNLAMSWMLWGGPIRIAVVWCITWLINSAAHKWGYRSFDTDDDSRNCWFIAPFTFGEWGHNYHHWKQTMAAHSIKLWEKMFDTTYHVICVMGWLGLAWNIKHPPKL